MRKPLPLGKGIRKRSSCNRCRKGIEACDHGEWKVAQRFFQKGYELSKADHSVLELDFCLHLADLEQINNHPGKERFYLKKACALAREWKKTDKEIIALSNLGRSEERRVGKE